MRIFPVRFVPRSMLEPASCIHPLLVCLAISMGGARPGIFTLGREDVALETRSAIPRKGNGIAPKAEPDALLSWYRLEFELPEKRADEWIPWRLLINASGNGYLWLNGHDIGRYWEVGPQREFFLPDCWLKFGNGQKSVLVLASRQTINGARRNAAEVSPCPDSAEQPPVKLKSHAHE